ncbi:MAG: YcgL domain-containing protein [Pseudomonadales bacterium]
MNVLVYKSSLREYLYIYVPESEGLSRVPSGLLAQFGEASVVMRLSLEPGQQLAKVSGDEVIEAVTEKGYFLQMPPIESI